MPDRSNTILQKIFIGVTVPLASLSATILVLHLFVPQTHESIMAPQSVASVKMHDLPVAIPALPPVQIKIDKVAIAAPVNPVGLTASGAMDIEANPNEVAWYQFGPKPGEEGSAVIAGHFGWKDAIPSIFNNLNKLSKGDLITTIDADGLAKVFVVMRTAMYAPNQDATDVFKSDDGKAHLNLITCQGVWNAAQQTYSERFIVFTDLLDTSL